MKKNLLLIMTSFLLLFVVFSGCNEENKNNNTIYGKWLCQGTDPDHYIVFNNDGTFVEIYPLPGGADYEIGGTWKFEEGKIWNGENYNLIVSLENAGTRYYYHELDYLADGSDWLFMFNAESLTRYGYERAD